MKTLWRISNHLDLNGEGGRIGAARWHTKGRPILYMAESPAGAMLERIVHLYDEDGGLPDIYQLLAVALPEEIAIKSLNEIAPIDWKENPEFTQQLGNAWLASRETPLARVPSAIMPQTWNVLLNPEHPDASQIKIASVIRERFDNRLFRFGGH